MGIPHGQLRFAESLACKAVDGVTEQRTNFVIDGKSYRESQKRATGGKRRASIRPFTATGFLPGQAPDKPGDNLARPGMA